MSTWIQCFECVAVIWNASSLLTKLSAIKVLVSPVRDPELAGTWEMMLMEYTGETAA